jgi:ankyrin repeat protein
MLSLYRSVITLASFEALSPARRRLVRRFASEAYGEDYGYQSDGKDRVSIATVCFAVQQPAAIAAGSTAAAKGSSRMSDALPAQSKEQPIERAATDRLEGPGPDRLGSTRLWWAARDGRRADVERLLAAGENPNAADVDGETPLHAAARWGHTAIVETLLAQGADPGIAALYGMTPLHVAVEESRLGTTQALLERGSDANARDMFGASPLHRAAAQGNQGLATLLLAYGADPWALDDSATTPLQLAVRSGNEPLAKLLSVYATTTPRARRALASSAVGDSAGI